MDFAQERAVASQKHLNLFDGPDENAERQRIYNEAKNKWPIDEELSSCDHLIATSKAIKAAIDAAYQTKSIDDGKGNQRVQNRIIDAYTWRKNDVDGMYNSKNCDEVIKDQESKEFFDTQYQNLEKVKGLTEETGNTTKYLIFGMLGLVVVVSGIIIFKK